MKANELHDKPLNELKEEETRLRKELFDSKFKHGTRQLLDTASLKRTRRDLARVLTVITQKQTTQNAEAAKAWCPSEPVCSIEERRNSRIFCVN